MPQTQSELQSVREELTRERKSCEELKQKLTAAEKELKSSAVMNLELEDYQRSMKTLEEQLTSRSSELERVKKDGRLQQDAMMQLKKELGKVVLRDSYLLFWDHYKLSSGGFCLLCVCE